MQSVTYPKQKGGLHIHLLLDESGSMGHAQETVIRAANEYVRQLQFALIPVRMTMATFGGRSRTLLTDVPIYAVPLLTTADYRPTGGTPLYDAMLRTVRLLEKEQGMRVMIVLTDGVDGSEHRVLAKEIEAKIAEGWLVLYMGINLDQMEKDHGERYGLAHQTSLINIPPDMAANVKDHNIVPAMEAAAGVTFRFLGGAGGAFTNEERAAMNAKKPRKIKTTEEEEQV
jgi:hypothetical protein